MNQIPTWLIPKMSWRKTLQYSFMNDFPGINVIPKAGYLMMSGKEAESSSAVTWGKFLGRSGPAHNSIASQQLLVSLPEFPLGRTRHFQASGAIDILCAFNSYWFHPILFTKITLPLLAMPHNTPASCRVTGRHNASFFIENGFSSAAVWRYPFPCTFFPLTFSNSDEKVFAASSLTHRSWVSILLGTGKRKPISPHTCQTNPGDLALSSRHMELLKPKVFLSSTLLHTSSGDPSGRLHFP